MHYTHRDSYDRFVMVCIKPGSQEIPYVYTNVLNRMNLHTILYNSLYSHSPTDGSPHRGWPGT